MREVIKIDKISESDKARFWNKVDVRGQNECWNWNSRIRNSGYGVMWWYGQGVSAHRLSWTIHSGPIPDGLLVLHNCDNKRCVNPNHLYLGTSGDNMIDTLNRVHPKSGRVSMFSASDIEHIKELRKEGKTQKEIAEVYKCSRTHILHIVNNNKTFLGVNLRHGT